MEREVGGFLVRLAVPRNNAPPATGREYRRQNNRMDGKVKSMGEFCATLGIGGPGTSIEEFCTLVKIITKRHGNEVVVSECDGDGKMHFSKDKQHLGYIEIKTGSLVWDPVTK